MHDSLCSHQPCTTPWGIPICYDTLYSYSFAIWLPPLGFHLIMTLTSTKPIIRDKFSHEMMKLAGDGNFGEKNDEVSFLPSSLAPHYFSVVSLLSSTSESVEWKVCVRSCVRSGVVHTSDLQQLVGSIFLHQLSRSSAVTLSSSPICTVLPTPLPAFSPLNFDTIVSPTTTWSAQNHRTFSTSCPPARARRLIEHALHPPSPTWIQIHVHTRLPTAQVSLQTTLLYLQACSRSLTQWFSFERFCSKYMRPSLVVIYIYISLQIFLSACICSFTRRRELPNNERKIWLIDKNILHELQKNNYTGKSENENNKWKPLITKRFQATNRKHNACCRADYVTHLGSFGV